MLRSTITVESLRTATCLTRHRHTGRGLGSSARSPLRALRLSRPSQQSLERTLALARSRPFKIALTACLSLVGVAAAALTVRHFVENGWPLANADPWLVVAAGALFIGAYAAKALGWKRLFHRDVRPSAPALAAATGAATVTGVALPGRFDDVVRVTVVRRFRTSRAGFGAICLSIVLVGFLDSAALTPLASIAAGLTAPSLWPRRRLV